MKITIDNMLRIEGLDESNARYWRKRCEHVNPAFDAARRDGRYTGATRDNPEGIPERLRLWEDDPGALVLPRGLLREVRARHPLAEVRDARICPPCTLATTQAVTLRDYQEPAVRDAITATQGIVWSPTGSGKTVMAIALMERLRTPAMMLVNTTVLLEQTARQIRKFLGVPAGMIGDDRFEPGDLTVSTIQTLATWLANPAAAWKVRMVADRCGLLILDEAHHGAATTFRAIVQAFPARYRFGLTATPNRTDKLTQMVFDCVGPIVHRVPASVLLANGAIVPARVVPVRTGFAMRQLPMQRRTPAQEARLKRMGGSTRPRIDTVTLINMLCADMERTQFVVDEVRRLHESRSLVLTERVEHAKTLAAGLRAAGIQAAALTGDMPKKQRQDILDRLASGTLPVMVSIPSLVGEGFDLPAIDTVFLAVPNGNPNKTTQILGRVLRPYPGKDRGRIVDFCDDGVPLLRKYAADRAAVYKRFETGGMLPLGRTA